MTIGFLLITNLGIACENNYDKILNKKENSTKEMNSDSCTKDCCKKTSNSKNKKHSCDGKCSHTNCTTSSLQLSIPTSNDFDLQNSIFNFLIEKPIAYYKEVNISDGFTSIWLPPKI